MTFDGSEGSVAMSSENTLGNEADRPETAAAETATSVSRRNAFGRMAQYTAPVMLAMLVSTGKVMAVTSVD
jgi:hypothetical protein